MPRKALTLEQLVAEGRFDPTNWRHRRALDESSPLEDPELEAARRNVLSYRRTGDRAWGAWALREFARLIAEERPLLVLEHVAEREHIVDGEAVI
jgi:hypothetical protein